MWENALHSRTITRHYGKMVADLVIPMYYLQALSIATDKYYGTKLNLLFDMYKGMKASRYTEVLRALKLYYETHTRKIHGISVIGTEI